MPRTPTLVRPRPVTPAYDRTAPGQIVPYRPQDPPQRIYPQPIASPLSPRPTASPKASSPDVIDAEIVPTQNSRPAAPRRPVVDSSARPSSQSAHPQRYPQYPNDLNGFATIADWEAWRNGTNKSQIDEQREAYEFTKDWGKTGGLLYPFTEYGPRYPILSRNFDLANQYRARNGLPAIDRFGNELAPAAHPDLQPAPGYQSNPLKAPIPAPLPRPATPSNFPSDPYPFNIDPDTGLPYTPTQLERGNELGRPPWHINPSSGNPWTDDLDPPVPYPLPFDSAPGGSLSRPIPNINSPSDTGFWTIKAVSSLDGSITDYSRAGRRGDVISTQDFGVANVLGEKPCRGISYNGSPIISCFSVYPFSLIVGFQPDSGAELDPAQDPTFSPLSRPPAPVPRANPTRTSPQNPQPNPPPPAQDPRVRPVQPSPLPGNPNPAPNHHPTAPRPLPSPVPRSLPSPVPNLPGSPYPPFAPTVAPNPSPTGAPRPNLDPSAQPSPARPQNPSPFEQLDRPPNKPPNKPVKTDDCSPCPDPCPTEELVKIRYKLFAGCNVDSNGRPNRFVIRELDVPASIAESIKITLDNIADLRAESCEPCCYWDLEPGQSQTVFDSIPPIEGIDILLPIGSASIVIEMDAAALVADNGLRNLKRFTNPITEANTFVNAAKIWIVNANGNAISSQELWTPKTEIAIPFEYRESRMAARLLTKSLTVKVRVSDSGKRWVQKVD